MSRNSTHVISTCLIGVGACAWAFGGRPLMSNDEINVPLNPLGINGSPYGEVFAMAMQGPIENYFHGGNAGLGQAADHGGHGSDQMLTAEKGKEPSKPSLESRYEKHLASLGEAVAIRTNPKAANEAHKRFLRRQVEDKLRFAYQLDPSHYANYNALNLFLTEPQLGTRPELTPSAAKLADETIQYCLKRNDDPRPALTAAAAASNILQLMFADSHNKEPKFTTAQMRQYLALLDYCLNRFSSISQEWEQTQNWALLSPQRIAECEERYAFIRRIRETAATTIERIEGQPQEPQASN